MEFKTSGELLKQIRKTLSITQRELGMEKINHNTISRIESNTESVTYLLALRLSENINYISSKKGIQVNISALELLETEEEKCEKWCKNELNNIKLSNDTDENIARYDEIIMLSEKYKLKNITIKAHELYSNLLYTLSRYQESIFHYNKCIEFYKDNDNLLKEIEINNKIGMCFYTTDLEESYKYHYKAYELLENMDKIEDSIRLKVEVVYFIALYHARKEDFGCAKEYLDSIINLYSEDNDLKVKISILQGNILLRQNNYSKAIEILESLIILDKELIAPYEYMIYNNMGICLNHLGDYENSIRCLTKAIQLQLDKNSPDLTNSLIHAGKLHIKLSQDDIAMRFIEAAIGNAIKHGQSKYIFECNELLYSIFRKRNLLEDCFNVTEKCKQTLIEYKLHEDFKYRYCVMKVDYFIFNNDLQSAKDLLANIIIRKEIH